MIFDSNYKERRLCLVSRTNNIKIGFDMVYIKKILKGFHVITVFVVQKPYLF